LSYNTVFVKLQGCFFASSLRGFSCFGLYSGLSLFRNYEDGQMKKIKSLLTLLSLIFCSCIFLFGQANQKEPAILSRDYVVEITYYKGRQLAYQRIGEGAWYDLFPRIADWKPHTNELPVAAVRISPREEGVAVKVKVTTLRGPNHEIEDFVAEYTVSVAKTSVQELANFGVAPFELKLVRAPSTVAELPSITNETKSLVVSVEPASSTLPSFKARFVNSSAKQVTGFSYRTSINDETKLIGMPQGSQRRNAYCSWSGL
jgi:hypothetical protein